MNRSAPMKRTWMRRQSSKAAVRAKKLRDLKTDIVCRCLGRCENPRCGKRLKLDLHHVIKRSHLAPEQADTVDNLVAICRRCHERTDEHDASPHKLRVDAEGNEAFVFWEPTSIGALGMRYVRPE